MQIKEKWKKSVLTWLEIAMDDPFAVEVFEGKNSLGDVLSCHFLGETGQIAQQRKTIASVEIFHHHVQVIL